MKQTEEQKGLPQKIREGNVDVKEVNEANFASEVLEAKQPVLVDFWAPWCGPCKMLAPTLQEIAQHFGEKVKVVKVNIDHAADLAAEYGIRSIPTLLLFKEGKNIANSVGTSGKDVLINWIEKHSQ